MTDAELFNRFFYGGNFALPYLIRFYHPNAGTIRLVNNTEAVTLDGETYGVSTFEYTPPDTKGDGGHLKITAIDNELIEFAENADWQYRLDVVGVIAENGTVQKIKSYAHFYGSLSYGENMEIEFNLGKDDKLDMKFCPYTYDTDNNRGNA